MIINHNMNAMNAHRLMSGNTANAGKSMEKLSSGLRINRAGDDAAGLAISEKMRGQIRGLDQASRNSQDGISMLQTAEGALNETHSILQRMRELATQSASDTNVGVDRTEIQKEMNQLSSEINRIGNTTEFNTKELLKGDGGVDIAKTTAFTDTTLAGGATTNFEATQATTLTAKAAAGDTMKFTLNGQEINVTFAAETADGHTAGQSYNVTGNSVTINIEAGAGDTTTQAASIKTALESVINANDTLKGNYAVSSAAAVLTVAATAGGEFAGSAGNIATTTETGTIAFTGAAASVGTTTQSFATKEISMAAVTSSATATAMVGKGITINGTQLEFYNSNDGAYTGNAQGIDISDAIEATANWDEAFVNAITTQANVDGVTLSPKTAALETLVVTAKTGGTVGNNISVTDGGIKTQFEATIQVGANKGQGFKIDINDMRAGALSVTGAAGADATEGAKFTTANSVTNGTDSLMREAALDVSSYENATAAVKVINNAIESVSAERSKLGAFQNRLEHTIANLGTSSENLTAAESRVRDVDMAKEMMSFSKNNILSQAAQAMLAQANQQPQGVLQLLR